MNRRIDEFTSGAGEGVVDLAVANPLLPVPDEDERRRAVLAVVAIVCWAVIFAVVFAAEVGWVR